MDMRTEIIEILEGFWPRNKAKGLLAQTVFMGEINKGGFGSEGKDKIMPGCWLLAPKEVDFYKFRFCFFVHPFVIKEDELTDDLKRIFGEKYRPFHAIAEFMNNTGIGIIYAICFTASGRLPFDEIKERNFKNIKWIFWRFQNGKFNQLNSEDFFGRWEGDRGRASYGHGWEENTKEKIKALDEEILNKLLLNEMFYIGFLKGTLKKPFNDPYDVDSFLISISQKHIFPMEIK